MVVALVEHFSSSSVESFEGVGESEREVSDAIGMHSLLRVGLWRFQRGLVGVEC